MNESSPLILVVWLSYKTKTLKNKDGPACTNCNDPVHIPSENQIKALIIYFYHKIYFEIFNLRLKVNNLFKSISSKRLAKITCIKYRNIKCLHTS